MPRAHRGEEVAQLGALEVAGVVGVDQVEEVDLDGLLPLLRGLHVDRRHRGAGCPAWQCTQVRRLLC